MGTWYRQYGRSHASTQTLAMLDTIETKLLAFDDPRPYVTSIRIGADLRDEYDYEVAVELTPGATLAVRYQLVDDEGRDPDALADELGAVAGHVVESVEEFLAHGPTSLADQLHALRLSTRGILAGWWSEGVHVTLVDMRFVRTDHVGADDAMAVEVRLRSLDDRLRPAIAALQAKRPDLLESVIVASRPGMGARFAARAELARQGADGWVDQLVVNAIAQNDDVATALRMVASGQPYGLAEELTVFMYDGHVRCHGRDAAKPDFAWNRSSVTIHGESPPETTLMALIGRPISGLVAHPVLSDDMIITRTSSKYGFGVHSITAEFDQPRLLFCSASGRTWHPIRL
jgi:hypothetical protein